MCKIAVRESREHLESVGECVAVRTLGKQDRKCKGSEARPMPDISGGGGNKDDCVAGTQ